MNREKYINNTFYREGYTDGYYEGVNTVISMFENYKQKFINDFTELNDNLNDIRARLQSEVKQ